MRGRPEDPGGRRRFATPATRLREASRMEGVKQSILGPFCTAQTTEDILGRKRLGRLFHGSRSLAFPLVLLPMP